MRPRILFVLILSLLSAVGLAAQPIELSNHHVTVRFGPRGLESLTDRASNAHIDFKSDTWSMVLGDRTLNENEAQPAVSQPAAGRVVYDYRWAGMHIQAVYWLESDWHFVAKRISVLEAPKSFMVHRVQPLALETATAPQTGFTPSIYAPHFGDTIEQTRNHLPGRDLGIFLRMDQKTGLMMLVQNPFLEVKREAGKVTESYSPEMEWKMAWGPFEADTACIGAYSLSGVRLPREMIKEWKAAPATMPDDGMDGAEIAAYSDCVRAFLIEPSAEPISVEVGWTLNDYQIDAGTEEGRAEYKRIIDTASALGVRTLLYGPANSTLSDREQSADSWKWDYVLWLGLGEKLRTGQWQPGRDPLPSSVASMLDYARQKNIGLLAYVYPSIPYDGNKEWIIEGRGGPDAQYRYSTLASRAFQDFLLAKLIAFQKQTGIAGYSFDYTFLNLPGASSYAQWHGWRRVMESLRRAVPGIVIDGRQSYQLYGPWSWLAGSYPHPTGTDEQPESFLPFPDLHFDRVSADRTRFVDYWYRNYQFAPAQVIPGYATHQTERSRNVVASDGKVEEQMLTTRYRPRDWDYLGFRYSFLSSIAVGGWNNVVDMIPARDEEELKNFSVEDKAWIRNWLQWTVRNKQKLLHTRTILDQPALGHVDGTSAIDGCSGFLFLFNPNYRAMPAAFALDRSIGLEACGPMLLREVEPAEGRLIGKPGAGVWQPGDRVKLTLDGTSATVLEVVPYAASNQPLLFNASRMQKESEPRASMHDGVIKVENAANEPGTGNEIGVLLPAGSHANRMIVNGKPVRMEQPGQYISAQVNFGGERFAQAEQIPLSPSSGNTFEGSFTVPQSIFDQLAERRRAWPIPWTTEDMETTWLAPERLLLYLQIGSPRDTMMVEATLDGKPLRFEPAYTSTRVHADSFVGFYADLSAIEPDRRHTIQLRTSGIAKEQLQGLFFDNVLPRWTVEVTP